jgi:hypothetical protein
MERTPPKSLDYATPRRPERGGTLVHGAVAGFLSLAAPISGWAMIKAYRTSGPALQLAVILWGGGNALGLVIGGIGWARARRTRPNWAYRACSFANTLNWLGLAGLAAVFFLD